MIKETAMPKLAPPGAGIPWPQKMLLRFIIGPFVAGRTDWSISEDRFNKLTDKILKEIADPRNQKKSGVIFKVEYSLNETLI